jgi:hypothetical protein
LGAIFLEGGWSRHPTRHSPPWGMGRRKARSSGNRPSDRSPLLKPGCASQIWVMIEHFTLIVDIAIIIVAAANSRVFPVPQSIFPFSLKKFPVRPLREFAGNLLMNEHRFRVRKATGRTNRRDSRLFCRFAGIFPQDRPGRKHAQPPTFAPRTRCCYARGWASIPASRSALKENTE